MVQVIDLPQQPTPMGWADLGQSLAQGAQGYVETQKEREHRAQMLADIQDARDYQQRQQQAEHVFESTEYDRREKAQTEMQALREKGQLQQKLVAALINEGYLSPNDADNKTAIATAFAAARRDGLVQKYSDLINHGYLNIAGIDDPQKVADAQAAAAKDTAGTFHQQIQDRADAKDTANAVSAQAEQLAARMQQIEADASIDPEKAAAAPPDPTKVANNAAQLARAANNGKPPSQAQVAGQMDAAATKIQQNNYLIAQQRQAAAKTLLPSMQRTYQELQTRLAQFEKMGIMPSGTPFAGPDETPDTGTDAATTLGQPAAVDPQAREKAIAVLAGKTPATAPTAAAASPAVRAPVGAPPSPTPTSLQPLQNPNNEALIQQENARRATVAQGKSAQDWQANLANPYNAQLDKVKELQDWINVLRNPLPGGGIPLTAQDRAERLSVAQQQLAQEQAKLEAARRAMLGLNAAQTLGQPATGSVTGSPALSNAAGSTPAAPAGSNWWATPNAAPLSAG